MDAASATVLSAGTATKLVLTTQPSTTAASGTALATQPVVQIQDASGNLVTSVAATQVTATAATGGTVTNGTATTVNGVATFTTLTLAGTAASYTFHFAVTTGLTPVDAAAATALATKLVLTTEPATGTASGSALPTQPVVQLQDVNSAAVAVAGITVTASAVSGTGVTITNGTAPSNGTGTATFSTLTLTKATGVQASYTLQFTAPGLTGVQAAALTHLATKVAVTAQPTAAELSGKPLGDQPQVQVQDVNGSGVSGTGVSITAGVKVTPPDSMFNTTATTGGGNTAFFSGLVMYGSALSYTLVFSAPGLDTATAAAPTRMAIKLGLSTQPPTTAASGVVLATVPVVQLQDAASALVPVPNISILVTQTSGSLSFANDPRRDGRYRRRDLHRPDAHCADASDR